jgi:hypothetical protein
MPWFQELTVWPNANQKNHCYLLNDGRNKLYAYVKADTNTVQEFKIPISFSVRGRQFKKIKDQWGVKIAQPTEGQTWTVTGSRGDSYTVTQNANRWSCSCSGFAFRNKCRHVDEIRTANSQLG